MNQNDMKDGKYATDNGIRYAATWGDYGVTVTDDNGEEHEYTWSEWNDLNPILLAVLNEDGEYEQVETANDTEMKTAVQKSCDHDTLERQLCTTADSGDAAYEEYVCTDCGVEITNVYEHSHTTIMYADETEEILKYK